MTFRHQSEVRDPSPVEEGMNVLYTDLYSLKRIILVRLRMSILLINREQTQIFLKIIDFCS